jgi:hypothetical protein
MLRALISTYEIVGRFQPSESFEPFQSLQPL